MVSITIILATMFLSAFFSGSEMAFLTSNKLIFEINKKNYPTISRIIERFNNHSGIFITTILIGNNVALVIYSLELSKLMNPFLTSLGFNDTLTMLVQTAISTGLILITAEFLPKTLTQINPSRILNIVALPMYVFYIIFYPISKLTQWISFIFLKLVFNINDAGKQKKIMLGRVDLDNLLTKHQSQPNSNKQLPNEVKLLKNALDFTKIKIRECTVPRTDIEAIEINDTIDNLKSKFIESGFSKILVYRDTIDNIIGYVHVSELFKSPKRIKNVMNPVSIVPETMSANKLLEQFTKQHKSIALVVDEFGGTSGLITIEDILEEIFGEIDDEHDSYEYIEEVISDTEYRFSARLEIDYINDKYNIKLPVSEEYETIAGMILWYNQSIPKPGESTVIDGFKIEITEATTTKIEEVKLEIIRE
jgi:CBS domain containing-hemolysin-like protein